MYSLPLRICHSLLVVIESCPYCLSSSFHFFLFPSSTLFLPFSSFPFIFFLVSPLILFPLDPLHYHFTSLLLFLFPYDSYSLFPPHPKPIPVLSFFLPSLIPFLFTSLSHSFPPSLYLCPHIHSLSFPLPFHPYPFLPLLATPFFVPLISSSILCFSLLPNPFRSSSSNFLILVLPFFYICYFVTPFPFLSPNF